MTICDICNREPATITRFGTILKAVEMMRQYDVGELVVVEEKDGRSMPVGIITDRDIVEKTVAENLSIDTVTVEEVMNPKLMTVNESESISKTFQLMHYKGLRRVPVVDNQGSLTGLLFIDSLFDFVIEEKEELYKHLIHEKEKEEKKEPAVTEIKKLTIKGGYGKTGEKEPVDEVSMEMGNVVSIVGPTGSGKTMLINDIELFANENTPSRRKILINDATPPEEFAFDASKNPIALITQHTTFISDLPVKTFLETHARIRQSGKIESILEETLNFANQLTGESINSESAMTELSGGQTRALLIADAVIIGHSPIILLDEIENAGIHRAKALEMLRKYDKIFLFVTHDLRIALNSDFRIVMKNGAMQKVIATEDEEQRVAERIKRLDDLVLDFVKKLRTGERLSQKRLKEYQEETGACRICSYGVKEKKEEKVIRDWKKDFWKW